MKKERKKYLRESLEGHDFPKDIIIPKSETYLLWGKKGKKDWNIMYIAFFPFGRYKKGWKGLDE